MHRREILKTTGIVAGLTINSGCIGEEDISDNAEILSHEMYKDGNLPEYQSLFVDAIVQVTSDEIVDVGLFCSFLDGDGKELYRDGIIQTDQNPEEELKFQFTYRGSANQKLVGDIINEVDDYQLDFGTRAECNDTYCTTVLG